MSMTDFIFNRYRKLIVNSVVSHGSDLDGSFSGSQRKEPLRSNTECICNIK